MLQYGKGVLPGALTMKEDDRAGLRAFGLFWFIALFVIWVCLRFSNPDMTSMRLLLTYWYIYVLYLVAGGVYLVAK